jgi:hypothetical protein
LKSEADLEVRSDPAGGELHWIRRLLLFLFFIGIAGLAAELVLLEHTESIWQWIPLVLLGVGLASGSAVGIRPAPLTIRLHQTVMILFVASGILGLVLHYQGNVEFELEMYPSLKGLELFWKSLGGATPSLAPMAMAQLGVLGLIQVFRHPANRRR